jgi:two-component system OmpR family sensor kinase
VIEERSDTIEETIDEVKHLTRQTGEGQYTARPIDIERTLEESTRWVTDRYPDAEVAVEPIPDGAHVRADEHLAQVFSHLLENAIVHAEDRTPTVSVTRTSTTVRVSVADEGAGLPAMQRELLEAGEIGEFDDPTTGFGLNIVRLLVEGYDGTIETDVTSDGTTITVVLPRSERRTAGLWPSQRELGSVRPAVPHLFVTLVAAVIGVFYGAANPIVGWLTHEFHSIVFGFVFVGLVSIVPPEHRSSLGVYLGIGIGWSLVLWAVAASVIGPVWLQLLGLPVPLPNFSLHILLSHLAWGVTLALLCAWGFEHLSPWLGAVRGPEEA